MKASKYTSALVVTGLALSVFAGACGDSGGNGGSGGATASSASSTKASSSSKATVTSSGAGGAMGSGICGSDLTIDGAVIDGCNTANCCASFNPCVADADCTACLMDPTTAGCDTNALYMAISTCQNTNCPTAICGGMLGTQSPNLNACVNGSCCASFTPCEADTACNACLQDPMGTGCDMLALFQTYKTCEDTNCPGDICGTQIIFGITYDNMSQDTDYKANLCSQTHCCADLTACADPTGDGFLMMNDPEVAACLLCLQGDAACMAGAVKTASDMFSACVMTNMCTM